MRNPALDASLRVIEIDGEPWFVARDACRMLGYHDGRWAVREHTEPHQRNTVRISHGIRGNPNKSVVSEGGLYSLILGSKLPEARRVKVWVTDEVLPAIRKDGGYQYGQEKVVTGGC